MASGSVQEWSLDGVLDEISEIHRTMDDRSLAFVLGAGASAASGIPAARQLADRWLGELHARECLDGAGLAEWVGSDALGIAGLTLETAADFYPRIFERRFRDDPGAGYAALDAAMADKPPSLGYSLLAEIVGRTRHRVVVTTNFDNLVADALAMHAAQPPLIVAHDSLAGFVRPGLRRPLVAKIHRDPWRDPAGVDPFEAGWRDALGKLFRHYTPIFIGYGGNDGSLMGFLRDLERGDIPGRMVWCYREGEATSRRVDEVISRHDGVKVAIAGFDEFMLDLCDRLLEDFDLSAIAQRTERLGRERADIYREQAEALRIRLAAGGPARQRTRDLLDEFSRDEKNWRTWEIRAQSEADPSRKNKIYQQGIAHAPGSPELHGNYAIFLANERKNLDAAEAMYRKALDRDPYHANNTRNYAIFLERNRKDLDAAEAMYKKALALDPDHAGCAGNYANFLAVERNDADAAEAMYKKALALDPDHADNTGNYALFLADGRRDPDAAEAMYKKALEIDPDNANNARNYAHFLADARRDVDAAAEMYQRALDLDPDHADSAGNYALFLANDRKDLHAAEAMYQRALEIDPDHANNARNYALFLLDGRRDLDAAEAMFKKSLELNPDDADQQANYASLLLARGTNADIILARLLCLQAVELSEAPLSQACTEALLYLCLCSELLGDDPAPAMAQLKNVLSTGFNRGGCGFSPVFATALPRVRKDFRDLYEAIGEAISTGDAVKRLDRFEVWRALEPADLPG